MENALPVEYPMVIYELWPASEIGHYGSNQPLRSAG
jgi:hypothetical protein